ncbi:hypothetical protein AX774_g1145 [Zancudomyces culisetae]|uniref:Uncharacterized protein n=1 Tax=Zancudomyces culisetae TaxID=1213189 RepID=A0A1R1PWF0_ZANCU|nr:hypothetical protein AX774_g1145 [Zancudomyces culisetae]|eukprot:OMH85300.1 hypothetical protein AX774_g1145 [Zancudomyces culisetae]
MVNTARVEAAFGKNTENASDEKNEKVEDVEEHAFDVYEYEKEPNLCRMRHRNIEKEMDFAEKTILSKIEFKEEEKNLDGTKILKTPNRDMLI